MLRAFLRVCRGSSFSPAKAASTSPRANASTRSGERASRPASAASAGTSSVTRFARHLVDAGRRRSRPIQELLGHATIDMTMRYAHLSPGRRVVTPCACSTVGPKQKPALTASICGTMSGRIRSRSSEVSRENQWRRRESNPGPQGFQLTFVHVRSRRIPGDWVRGFGRDLSLANLDHAIEGTLARPSPGG